MHTNPEVLALVALGEREAASSEELAHIAGCEACGREVTELGELKEIGRTISDHFTLETPTPEVWDRIRAELGFADGFSSDLVPPTVSPVSRPALSVVTQPAVSAQDRHEAAPRRERRFVSLALAAVLALLAGVGGTLAWQQLSGTQETVITSSPLQALPAWSGATGTVTLEEDENGTRSLVITMVAPRPVDGIQQVWLADSTANSMTPIGPLSEPGQRFVLPENLDVERFPLVDISVQEAGGNPAHSGNSIVRGTLDV